jgi:hypothetical protein
MPYAPQGVTGLDDDDDDGVVMMMMMMGGDGGGGGGAGGSSGGGGGDDDDDDISGYKNISPHSVLSFKLRTLFSDALASKSQKKFFKFHF